jgi:ubiquinone/menaquinone biosynthesis C-methylase UbiE
MSDADAMRREIAEYWERAAPGWGTSRAAFQAGAEPVSHWLVEAVDPQPGLRILELAAGPGDTGLLAAELLRPHGTLILSDVSEGMLEIARARAKELGVSNVEFRQIDAEWIDLPTADVDGVICRWGYMLMADPVTALRETRRVLKPGGRVALSAWSDPSDNPWGALPSQELIARGLVEPPQQGLPGQFAWAKEGVIGEHLEAAGFAEHRVEALEFTYEYRSAADWWASQSDFSVWFAAAVARASDDDLAAVGDAIDRHAERFATPDGTLRVPARTWLAWAAA